MKTLFVFFLSMLFLILSCRYKNHFSNTEWLIGTWVNQTNKANIYESWTKKNAREMSATNYILKEGDTVVLETVKLIQENDSLFYVPTVNNQNDAKPIRFSMTTISENEMIFENPDHDFPQIIRYKRIHRDSLVASIKGKRNGKEESMDFPMKRVKK